MTRARPALALLLGVLLACSGDTSRLTPELESRFATEGIRRRAANVWFRYTHDAGTRSAGWEDRLGSIVVTNQTVLVYKNQKIGIEITAASQRFYEVTRDGARVASAPARVRRGRYGRSSRPTTRWGGPKTFGR